jgi:dTDP-4-dehydrorhamnose reductase
MSSAQSVVLLGASGLLGGALARTLGERVAVRTHLAHSLPGGVRFDARSSSVAELLQGLGARPQAAAVLLGITNIDACAKDPEGTAAVNVQGVTRVIRELSALGILPVFTSSDAVFEGTRAWSTEDDEARPILTYGRQKLEVERFMASLDGPWLAVRLPKLLEPVLDGWLRDLARPEVIDCATDQFFTPAAADDAARAIVALLDKGVRGLRHVAGAERLSRRDLLQAVVEEYRKFSEPRASIRECSLRDLKQVVEPRPLDTSMRSARAVPPLQAASAVARAYVRKHFARA